MVIKKEISSTGNLLQVIRGEKEIFQGTPEGRLAPAGNTEKVSVAPVGFDPRKTSVGISFDDTGMHFFAIEKSPKQKKIIDYLFVSIALQEKNTDADAIKKALQNEDVVERFQLKKTQNWFLISSDIIDFWTVAIPKKIEEKDRPKAIYWAAKSKNSFDESQTVFDYYLIDEFSEKGVEKIRAGVYTIPKQEVLKIRTLFEKIGVVLQGISTFSLCCNQLIEQKKTSATDGPVAVIAVHREWSRIDLFHNNALAFTRRIKTGIESFAASIQERSALASEPDDAPGGLESLSLSENLNLEDAYALFDAQAVTDSEAQSSGMHEKFSDEKFIELIEPAAYRLVRQIERTVAHFRSTMQVPALKNLIFVGSLARFLPVVNHIGAQLDVQVDVLDPFTLSGLTPALPVPSSFHEKTLYTPACAAALAEFSHTPNFLHNYQDRLDQLQLKRIHRILGMIFIGGLSCTLGMFVWGQQVLQGKSKRHTMIQKELAQYSGDISSAQTTKVLGQLNKKTLDLKLYEKRFKPVAIFSEIAHVTPQSIKLNSILTTSSEKGDKSTIVVDGYVVGQRIMLDSYLSNYIVMLDKSLLFSDLKIQKRDNIKKGDDEKIHFVVSANVS